MCGIVGIYRADNETVNLLSLEDAVTSLRHRGPDDEGYLLVQTRSNRVVPCGGRKADTTLNLPPLEIYDYEPFNLALGFRRLSILDLSPAGHQPMSSADGTCWIVFNGEVYNYVELRQELSGLGHRFRTGTDTEVVLAAYDEWGATCLKRFVGMWAFALLDTRERHLFLSRDPFGIKPLYYVHKEGRFAFASEIKALLKAGEASRQVNPTRLYEYLSRGRTDHGAETLFAEVRQVPPACSLLIPLDKPGTAHLTRYWQLDLDRKSSISFEDAAAHLRELFLESIKLHLRSDVPVGTALSGGIDSSAIVTAVRATEPQLALHAFSYIAEDAAINEESWLEMAGTAAGAQLHKVKPNATELVADLDALIHTQDEPFGSTSIYAQHRVFRLARENGITVMLDGQGADEMLAGYRSYLAARLASLLRQWHWVQAVGFTRRASTLPDTSGRLLLIEAGGVLLPSVMGSGRLPAGLRKLARMILRSNGASSDWLNKQWFEEQGLDSTRSANGRHRRLLQKSLYDTLVETNLPMLLRYEDRNSMAHSIESRVPFLTTTLAEFIFALPEDYVIARDGTSKSVFRAAMRGLVPDPILDRRDKIGFATPEQAWLASLRPWVEEVLSSDTAARIPALNLSAVSREWEAILSGTAVFDWRVWRWLNVIRWAECFRVSF